MDSPHNEFPNLHLADRSLEVDGADFEVLVAVAARHLAQHLDQLGDMDAWSTEGGDDLARSVVEPAPQTPSADWEELIARVVHDLTSVSFVTPSPGYMAFVPGGGLPHAAIADLIAATINRFVTVWVASPALNQLENTVIRWFCDALGLPPAGGGYLTTGGSMSNWSALVTARRCRLPEDFLDGCIYVSDQAHHSIQKASMLAGFPINNVRIIPADDACRLDMERLDRQVEADFEAGLKPFLVAANAGTTNTGAIDDLDAIRQFTSEREMWMHVDAAYGGFFAWTERGKERMKGIETADSVTLDPHKGLFMPYGLGCLLVQRQEDLRITHHVDGAYMPNMQDAEEFVDISSISPELSRGFRGLRVWLPIQLVGMDVFRQLLDEKLDLAAWAHDELSEIEGLELVGAPQLTTIAFRYTPSGMTDETEINEWNRQWLKRLNAAKRFYLTSTTVRGRFVIRICIVSFRTHFEQVEFCVKTIKEQLARR